MANINKMTYKPNKLGHTDLPFGFCSVIHQ